MNGFVNIIKPSGMSSAFAVGIAKRRLKTNCGHMGTLDPMASGVLPLGLNKASRLFQYLLDKEKTYVAELKFGEETDTLDKTGKIINVTKVIPDEKKLKEVLPYFIGEISQVPPLYSAKCVNGKRGYELARQGVEFVLPPKNVIINNIQIKKQISEDTFSIEVTCKGGTYIRSLIRDIGYKTDSLATMTKLDRTSAGVFNYSNGIDVEELKNISDNIEKYIIKPDEVINYEKLFLNSKMSTRLLNGLYDEYDLNDGLYRIYSNEYFWGVGEIKNKILVMKSYVREDV